MENNYYRFDCTSIKAADYDSKVQSTQKVKLSNIKKCDNGFMLYENNTEPITNLTAHN